MLNKLKLLISEILIFLKKNGLFNSLKINETPLILQIVKYLIFGVSVTLVHAIVVYGMGYYLNPAIGESIPRDIKLNRTIFNNIIAFIISNSTAFWLNSKYLFKPGRHSKVNEVLLFFLISGLSFALGLFSIKKIFILIESNAAVEHLANLTFIVCSASVNFICRKFLVFSK